MTDKKQVDERRPVAMTYRPHTMPAGLGSVTPPGECDAAIQQIVATWNDRMPVNHVRRVNQYRYRQLRRALADFTAEEICAAIELYSRSTWNRQNRAWMKFDNFILLPKITAKIEDAEEAAEHRNAAGRRQRDDAAAQQKRDNDQAAAQGAAVTAFERLGPKRRRELLGRAETEMVAKHVPRYLVTPKSVLRWAVAILWKEEAGE